MPDARKIILLAFLSRFLVWIIGVSGLLIDDYDSSASVAYQLENFLNQPDFLVKRIFGMFANWDGLYFLGVAEHGYKYEQFHMAHPGLPILLRGGAELMSSLFGEVLSLHSWFLLLGFVLANLCFIIAALALYKLTLHLFGPSFAFKTAALFCINPASIFMSSVYTESFFALATFGGLYLLIVRDRPIFASFSFAVGSVFRSNGMVAAGFILFQGLHQLVPLLSKKSSKLQCLWVTLRTICCCLLTVGPVFAFGLYGYSLYCTSPQEVERSWCHDSIPNLYSFVQSEYWNVGFLRYFEKKQIPNFLLAAPILLISYSGIISYLSYDWYRVVSLGFLPAQPSGGGVARELRQYLNRPILEFIVHWLVLTLIATFVMHVQVSTRFIASQCAPFYWFSVVLVEKYPRLLLAYFSIYFVVGTLLFTNFYPWT